MGVCQPDGCREGQVEGTAGAKTQRYGEHSRSSRGCSGCREGKHGAKGPEAGAEPGWEGAWLLATESGLPRAGPAYLSSSVQWITV